MANTSARSITPIRVLKNPVRERTSTPDAGKPLSIASALRSCGADELDNVALTTIFSDVSAARARTRNVFSYVFVEEDCVQVVIQ